MLWSNIRYRFLYRRIMSCERGGDEEIFLLEAKLFSLEGIVVGIENLGDVFRKVLGVHGADVVAGVEVAEVEFIGGAGTPETQRIDGAVEIAGDWRVVGDGKDIFGIDPLRDKAALVVGELMHAAMIMNAHAIERAGHFPGVAISKPGVGHFHLRAVDDALMEDSVVVADAVAVGGDLQCGQRIQEARRKPPEPAIAKAGIPFGVAQFLQLIAQVARCLGALRRAGRG